MKSKFLVSSLALVSASLMPLMAAGQVSPASGSNTAEREPPTFKYEVSAGFSYTTLKNVTQSKSGLMGVNASVTRDWGKYFGITAEGGYYKYPYRSGNPGNPLIIMGFVGPVVHAELFGKVGIFAHGLMGVEHLGGETGVTPNISFAGGIGGGLEYKLGPRLSMRASGDDIGSAFSETGNSPQLGYSPHQTWSSRATLGAVYRF